jgi:hypothetical protein
MAILTEYRFGHLVIDGQTFTKDVVVLPQRVVSNWWRVDGHSLCMEDLEDVIDELPEALVIGTGHDGRMRPQADVLELLRSRGIAVEVMPTAEAVRRYGELDSAATAAALHLNC